VTATANGTQLKWYRVPLKREDLSALNRKSDLKGFIQTGGFLGLLALTGTAAFSAPGRVPWYLAIVAVYIHGMCWNFLINGFHELVHDSVFKTRRLNGLFLRIFSFLGWYNHVGFWASHTEHHKFTLHPPDDLEVVLPTRLTLGGFLQGAVVNPWLFVATIKSTFRHATGRLNGEWEHHLFDEDPQLHRKLINWARVLLIGHGLLLAIACVFKLWMLPVVISLAPFYGGALHYLCNNSQHAGLRDNVEDFRLCCRTLYLNPVFEFLYWHMNYHTEHHMYAGVPCYNLPRLHRLIRHEMPVCPSGLLETWRGIRTILERQAADPEYQWTAELPQMAKALGRNHV
jgi:fatty acid desaturase